MYPPKKIKTTMEALGNEKNNPFTVSFEEMDVQWDSIKKCFVVGKKRV